MRPIQARLIRTSTAAGAAVVRIDLGLPSLHMPSEAATVTVGVAGPSLAVLAMAVAETVKAMPTVLVVLIQRNWCTESELVFIFGEDNDELNLHFLKRQRWCF